MYYVVNLIEEYGVFLSIDGPFDSLTAADHYGIAYCEAYKVYLLNNGKMMEIE